MERFEPMGNADETGYCSLNGPFKNWQLDAGNQFFWRLDRNWPSVNDNKSSLLPGEQRPLETNLFTF